MHRYAISHSDLADALVSYFTPGMGSNTYLYLKTNTNTITNKYLYLYLNAAEKKYLYLYLNKVFAFDANTFQILFKYFLDIYSFFQPNVYFSLEIVH